MSPSTKSNRARPPSLTICVVTALAVSAFATAPTRAQDDTWTPTGFDEHSRAAWAAIVDFCGADMPERPSDEAIADICAQSYEISLLYLATLMAWSQLPSSEGGMIDMQVFPDIDEAWQARIAVLAADIDPPWTIVANPDIARAPASIRPMLIDTIVQSYGTVQRLALARALIGEPQILILDEPTAADDGALDSGSAAVGDASAAAGDAAEVAADAVATPQPAPDSASVK